MKNELISVVVPIYNVEKYLKKCINSIISQTYSNLEIILVNDGSTDNSKKICNEFAYEDDRILVINKENGGLSSARNSGIEIAKGEYIVFIDSDDYIEIDMIENLYKGCVDNGAQIACCGKIIEKDPNIRIVNCKENFCVSKEEAIKKMLLLRDIDVSAVDKMYKLELFKSIRYPINKCYEDMGTTYKLFDKAQKIVHINKPEYHYVIRLNSITTTFSIKHLDMLSASKEMNEYIIEKYPQLTEISKSFCYLQYFAILLELHKANDKKQYKEQYKMIKKQYNSKILNILTNRYIPIYKKIMAILIFFKMYGIIDIVKKINRI